MGQVFFREVLENCITKEFLGRVAEKYHYPVREMDTLAELAVQMQICMLEEAAWNHHMYIGGPEMPKPEAFEPETPMVQMCEMGTPMAEVVMTLGKGVDDLQDEYLNKGALTESYMIEVLTDEILLEGYAAYNDWVASHTPYHVEKYVFLQGNMLGELPGILKRLELPIICNEAFCMLPKKSVAFYAQLTEDAMVRCRGICVDCERENCPNRAGREGVF